MVATVCVDNNFSADGVRSLPDVSAQALGKAARLRRVEMGLSQEDVRARSGLSITTISRIEHGSTKVRKPSLRRYDIAVGWPPGTAESFRAGRGGAVEGAYTAPSADELVELAVQLTPLIVENIRATATASVDVSGLTPEQIKAVETTVAAFRRSNGLDG